MTTHLLAPIVGQGLVHWVVHAIRGIAKPFKRSACTAVRDFGEHHQARAALNQSTHGGLIASTLDQIAFPVPRCKSIIGLTGALAKSCHIRNLPSTIKASRARPTRALTLAQTGNQLRPQRTTRHHIDRVMNRLIGHGLGGIISKHTLKCARNLFRRPALLKVRPHHIEENRVRRELWPTPLYTPELTSTPGTVNPALGGIALYLTADRRAATAECPSNCSDTRVLALHHHDRCSLLSIMSSYRLFIAAPYQGVALNF